MANITPYTVVPEELFGRNRTKEMIVAVIHVLTVCIDPERSASIVLWSLVFSSIFV